MGLIWVLLVEVVILVTTIRSWRQKRWVTWRTYLWRYGFPVIFLLVLLAVYSQLFGMAQYSDTCRALLSSIGGTLEKIPSLTP